MTEAYTILQSKSALITVLAVVFEQYNTSDIQYKIRHGLQIPTILFPNIFEESMYNSHTLYLSAIPFAQLQMCVDESLINHAALHSVIDREVLKNTE